MKRKRGDIFVNIYKMKMLNAFGNDEYGCIDGNLNENFQRSMLTYC
jgi:hypothetical protein